MKSLVASFGLLFVLTGCAIFNAPTFIPFAVTSEIDPVYPADTILSAKGGDVIFRQRIEGAKLYTLEDTFVVDKLSASGREYNVPAGTLLQPGVIYAEEGPGLGMCSLELTSKNRNLLGETRHTRTCFLDVDRSGDFDFAYQGDGSWSNIITPPNFDIKFRTLKAALLLGSVPIEQPIRYSYTGERSPVEASFFIYYHSQSNGGALLRMYSDLSGAQVQLVNGFKYISPDFPQTVEMNEVVIEIISVKDDTLEYRILDSIPEGVTISTDIG